MTRQNLSPDITPAGAGSITEGVIRFDRTLPGSVEELWEAVSARIDGDRVVYDFGEEGRATGEVTHSDPPRALVHTWNWPGLPESFVTWKVGEGNLRLTHEGLLGEEAVHYALGWHLILDEIEGVTSDPEALHTYYSGLLP
ncbi:MAG: hypothetical protein GX859_11540 [Corynebacterium humireducens]|uniref:Polyketide cyclase / dehydrase and lipid transport n=1 Tax=Corynebacterium humireducens TaxID=1223514 RepID=A0A7X6SWU1_9CORY|nr:hypothetical protein [Corynebacterium humireducens]